MSAAIPVTDKAPARWQRRWIESPAAALGLKGLLYWLALNFNNRASLRRHLYHDHGAFDFSIGFLTESGSIAQYLVCRDGRLHVRGRIEGRADARLIYRDEQAVRATLGATPNETLLHLLKNRVRSEGNMSVLALFSYLTALCLDRTYRRKLAQTRREGVGRLCREGAALDGAETAPPPRRRAERLRAGRCDRVEALDDPYLSAYGLDDFPRLKRLLEIQHATVPELCAELPLLRTRWHREHGFETRPDGTPWNPVLRQGEMLKYVLAHKQPRIRRDDLLAGTTTAKDIGPVLYPDAHGLLIWNELTTVSERPLNPYRIGDEERELLHREVFPYWLKRNFREWVRERHHEPACQRLDERFALYFLWKPVALSHTVCDLPRLLALGAEGMIAQIDADLARAAGADAERDATLRAMKLALEGLMLFGDHLAVQARAQAQREADPRRRAELEELARICAKVPRQPPDTLYEALQAVWTAWVALHQENTNAGLSLGRMDQWLQPYFLRDIAGRSGAARERYVRDTIERLGCFYLRCADHEPLTPDIGNYIVGGTAANQAITLGGVTPEGENAVNDMTYVFLKVTELLKIRDPNVNARYHAGKNSDAYLKRLCEVNLITTATPSIHGDENVMRALAAQGYPEADVRDWSVVGCVEPTLSGRHMGHTGSMMFNLVAGLEMALNDGRHPLLACQVGPHTGDPAQDAFPDFESFFAAYLRQLDFLAENATAYNRLLGEAHAELRPTPLLSAVMDGCRENGRDATRGGARYNSAGVACIGLADAVDSLMAIKRLVFEQRAVSLAELCRALEANFQGHERLRAAILNQVPKFGSGDPEPLALAQLVQRALRDMFGARPNYRGGRHLPGFWTMSKHVAFGNLSGALPSGRLATQAFTPGLTPSCRASKNLLDNLLDVSALDPACMPNNMAFNVKYVPSAEDSHAQAVDQMAAYVKAYVQGGGMQIQLNVVSSETLKDAMRHPERYRDLLVRISGYNAYFVMLNPDMQLELIERAQYG